MLDFTWKVFTFTGNIDTYLLFKELEKERTKDCQMKEEERTEVDLPV
ncbi:MAG: YqzL family protein [Bacillaceae bacterium]|jgi:hypothetical protein|uniref:YqzL family protein n=2 Tax=Aeribacillus TaxID=1055323 RepID=A0A223E9U6_9BACI|nr:MULTISPECIES: YqzL family protein [Aeribacillus]AXI40131.1 YqzL family protein [Bacillaceae bacterium ZC4]REJ21464.1 MAG: YqzL family protein [Bacillaceae bacterium]ASS91951.1 YqzL family protein [Aeribacillus pallidus]MDR9792113.1 YqzL family protein [Aeribacillus pallidus]MDR9795792.1 YqzL family protein [Aeribacillus pallidus]